MRRPLLAAAWAAGSIVSAALAWSAVAHVAPPPSEKGVEVLTARDVAAELVVSSPTAVAGVGAPSVTTSVPTGGTTPPPTTTVAPAGVATTTTRPPAITGPTVAPSSPAATTGSASPSTTAPPTTASSPTTTAPAPPLVITSSGGTLAVQCGQDSTLSVAWASPHPDYSYVPSEIERTHIHVRFVSSHSQSVIEVECQGAQPKVSVNEEDGEEGDD